MKLLALAALLVLAWLCKRPPRNAANVRVRVGLVHPLPVDESWEEG